MVKELAQLDLSFLSYSQKKLSTFAIFKKMLKNGQIWQFFGYNS